MQIKDLIPWSRERNEVSRKGDDNDNPVLSLQREINRVFENFWNHFDRPFDGRSGSLSVGTPSMDITESDQEVEVSVELPGMDEKDIEVTLTQDVLTIRGEKNVEKEEKKKGYHLSERSYGTFYRRVPLPPGIDTDKSKADFKKGVLTISLPKTAEAQAQVKRIKVNAA